MSKVYFKNFNGDSSAENVKKISKELLKTIIEKENIKLANEIPLKVHFGEAGNVTYIKPENFDGIIDFLEENNIKTQFIESTVMYGGQRHNKETHLKTAKDHGFTRIPVVIADGDHGESFYEVEINKKHFKKCKLGKEFSKYDQYIVCAHFKGHAIAGFGGAIKQLAMGFASKGGKIAQHLGIKPKIINRKCKKCNLCKKRCAEYAITIGKKSFINYDKCVGCGACFTICPHKAIAIITLKSAINFLLSHDSFKEKIAEYAYAAQIGKNNIYINFIMNVTAGCDCEPKKMKLLTDDIGILASTDPLALDQACFDIVTKRGIKFKGKKTLEYGEKIGLGSRKYELVSM